MSELDIITIDNQLVVDSRLIAQQLEVDHTNTFLKTIRKYQSDFESLGVLTFKKARPIASTVGGRPEVFCYLNKDQIILALSKSRNGLSDEAVNNFKKIGFDFSVFGTRTKKKRLKPRESDYSINLATQLNGKREVSTLAGNIDILTESEIIEVKSVQMWKHALGQVLVYGKYYPSHQKRIHLYGETQESFLKMIESHCRPLKIVVTWEP